LIGNGSSAATFQAFTQSGTGAVARTWQSKAADFISVKDFGAVGDGTTDDYAAIQAAIAAANGTTGAKIWFPPGTYRVTSTVTLGDGSNSQQSTKDHNITLIGAGYGTGADISNTQINGASRILYDGTTNSTAAVVALQGPLHNNAICDLQLDCNSKAGIGLNVIHVTQNSFDRVTVRNYTNIGYNLTSRNNFPSGCAYGNADNRFYDCYALQPANTSAIAIVATSGVSTSTSLVGLPDTARCVFIGGSFVYGGNTGSYGAYLAGADNNQFWNCLFYPSSGSSGGYDVWMEPWTGSPSFPLENNFIGCGMTRGVSGSSTGPTYGNFFWPFQTGDGAAVPSLATAQTMTYQGKTYINGVRAWRGRQITQFDSQTPQSTTSNTFVDVTGYSVSLAVNSDSKLRVTFTGSAAKSTSGQGFFILSIDGTQYGPTTSIVSSGGGYFTVSCEYLVSVPTAGTIVSKVMFRSDTPSSVTLNNGVLIVEELY
jgi:hypothetical protein